MVKDRSVIADAALIDQRAERRIHLVRGAKALMGSDLAALYGVPKHRPPQRTGSPELRPLPVDVAFRLTDDAIED